MRNSQDEPWHMALAGGVILFDLILEIVVVLRIFLNDDVGVFELVATLDFLLTGIMIARICWKIKETNEVWKYSHLKVLSGARMALSKELSERTEAQATAVGITTGQSLTGVSGVGGVTSSPSSPLASPRWTSSGIGGADGNTPAPFATTATGVPITKSEMLKVRLLFEALDLDHDGTVSLSELQKYYEGLAADPKWAKMRAVFKQKIPEIFKEADADNSKSLSLAEFAKHAYPLLRELEEPDQHLKLVFAALDHNDNGNLDKMEIISFFERVTGAHPSSSIFAAIDVNKDRKVERQEFVRAMKHLLDKEYRASYDQRQASDNQLKSMFQVLDSAIQEVQFNSSAVCVLGVEVDGQFLLQIFSAAVGGIVSGLTGLFPIH